MVGAVLHSGREHGRPGNLHTGVGRGTEESGDHGNDAHKIGVAFDTGDLGRGDLGPSLAVRNVASETGGVVGLDGPDGLSEPPHTVVGCSVLGRGNAVLPVGVGNFGHVANEAGSVGLHKGAVGHEGAPAGRVGGAEDLAALDLLFVGGAGPAHGGGVVGGRLFRAVVLVGHVVVDTVGVFGVVAPGGVADFAVNDLGQVRGGSAAVFLAHAVVGACGRGRVGAGFWAPGSQEEVVFALAALVVRVAQLHAVGREVRLDGEGLGPGHQGVALVAGCAVGDGSFVAIGAGRIIRVAVVGGVVPGFAGIAYQVEARLAEVAVVGDPVRVQTVVQVRDVHAGVVLADRAGLLQLLAGVALVLVGQVPVVGAAGDVLRHARGVVGVGVEAGVASGAGARVGGVAVHGLAVGHRRALAELAGRVEGVAVDAGGALVGDVAVQAGQVGGLAVLERSQAGQLVPGHGGPVVASETLVLVGVRGLAVLVGVVGERGGVPLGAHRHGRRLQEVGGVALLALVLVVLVDGAVVVGVPLGAGGPGKVVRGVGALLAGVLVRVLLAKLDGRFGVVLALLGVRDHVVGRAHRALVVGREDPAEADVLLLADGAGVRVPDHNCRVGPAGDVPEQVGRQRRDAGVESRVQEVVVGAHVALDVRGLQAVVHLGQLLALVRLHVVAGVAGGAGGRVGVHGALVDLGLPDGHAGAALLIVVGVAAHAGLGRFIVPLAEVLLVVGGHVDAGLIGGVHHLPGRAQEAGVRGREVEVYHLASLDSFLLAGVSRGVHHVALREVTDGGLVFGVAVERALAAVGSHVGQAHEA